MYLKPSPAIKFSWDINRKQLYAFLLMVAMFFALPIGIYTTANSYIRPEPEVLGAYTNYATTYAQELEKKQERAQEIGRAGGFITIGASLLSISVLAMAIYTQDEDRRDIIRIMDAS